MPSSAGEDEILIKSERKEKERKRKREKERKRKRKKDKKRGQLEGGGAFLQK